MGNFQKLVYFIKHLACEHVWFVNVLVRDGNGNHDLWMFSTPDVLAFRLVIYLLTYKKAILTSTDSRFSSSYQERSWPCFSWWMPERKHDMTWPGQFAATCCFHVTHRAAFNWVMLSRSNTNVRSASRTLKLSNKDDKIDKWKRNIDRLTDQQTDEVTWKFHRKNVKLVLKQFNTCSRLSQWVGYVMCVTLAVV